MTHRNEDGNTLAASGNESLSSGLHENPEACQK